MMVIPGTGSRTRALGLAVLAVTFLVGGLSGMAMQQARRGTVQAEVPSDGTLRLPDASGNLRPCPPPRQRFQPLDSIGASETQQDSIRTIMGRWQPKLEAAWREWDQVQDSAFARYEKRADAVRDSMQSETRAVLSDEQRTALLALYERRDSTRRAVRADMKDFEDRCRAARRSANDDGRGQDDAEDGTRTKDDGGDR